MAIMMYLDLEGYNSHQRNTNSELVYLRARMHRAKAEVEVYELAIENALASNFPDNGMCHCLRFLQIFMPLQLHRRHHHHHHVQISHRFYPKMSVATRITSMLNQWKTALLPIRCNGPYVSLGQDLGAPLGAHIFICFCTPIV
jgi:hypothetical protein